MAACEKNKKRVRRMKERAYDATMLQMKAVVPIYKPRGVTPLQVISHFKQSLPEYAEETISYAGRLDPMAEGLLILLIGDENKNRERYENLEKEYSFDILFGIRTDTYDTLGKVQYVTPPPSLETLQPNLLRILPDFLGQKRQPYPPYSSFHVNKKPLFYWAREGRLDEITIPHRNITIHSLKPTSFRVTPLAEIGKEIVANIQKVQGDFRQEEILTTWEKVINRYPTLSLPVATLVVICTSGTYVRSLAHRIGETIGCGGIASRIERTRVGSYTVGKARQIPS